MDIVNKTKRPLAVPLPQGKKLRLGPGKTGQVTPKALEHPPLKKMIEAGEIEVAGPGHHGAEGDGSSKVGRSSTRGFTPGGGMRQTGDR